MHFTRDFVSPTCLAASRYLYVVNNTLNIRNIQANTFLRQVYKIIFFEGPTFKKFFDATLFPAKDLAKCC